MFTKKYENFCYYDNNINNMFMSKKCFESDCMSIFFVRHGKFCGLSHYGCKNENPCDEYDKCC